MRIFWILKSEPCVVLKEVFEHIINQCFIYHLYLFPNIIKHVNIIKQPLIKYAHLKTIKYAHLKPNIIKQPLIKYAHLKTSIFEVYILSSGVADWCFSSSKNDNMM